ncbi:MAG: hypothetical protein ACLUH5_05380 [Eubacterium sp.]
MRKYSVELEGQKEFYNDYLKLVDSTLIIDDILADNTDGVLNGNILEFKLNITDLNAVLFQTIKYLSSMRIKGKPIPKNIILISLNDRIAYSYNSGDYLEDIEKVYLGSASKNNVGFSGNSPKSTLRYSENQNDEAKLIELLREKEYTKIHIDENCIVGWATKYYQMYSSARKADFIGETTGKVKIVGEIRNPNKFREYIYPYEGKSNKKFQYLMDKLNDKLQKKNLGAFYTHPLYAKKSLELLRKAIGNVPVGNDYIILDRCAGTGNLEQFLTEEELSHVVVSTVEYYEYKVLLELLGSKVRYVIPPTEKEDTFDMGLVKGADALSKEYIDNEYICKYINDEKCTIILFENPPYAESNGTTKINSDWKNSYVVQEMKKELKGTVTNDLGNAFIWSGFKYYLRQPTDCYIVYSPIKYWKIHHLVNKKILGSFAFNRKHFHTKIDACIMVVAWQNIDKDVEMFNTIGFDIDNGKLVETPEKLTIKKCHYTLAEKYYDKRIDYNDRTDGISCNLNGTEYCKENSSVKKIWNNNILGFLVANSAGFDNPDLNSGFTIAGRYDGHGFFLRKDNYLQKLPMFAATRYITYNKSWTERSRIMKSGDGSKHFINDVNNGKLDQFLLKCLLFTCLEMQNHMRTFYGSDGRFYKNNLCFDNTNGETIASKDIKKLQLNNKEKDLFNQWNKVFSVAKQTKNYDSKLTYGIYQIYAELNTMHIDEETGQEVADYPELNGHLQTLKKMIKDYYNEDIVPVLFDYEFLK